MGRIDRTREKPATLKGGKPLDAQQGGAGCPANAPEDPSPANRSKDDLVVAYATLVRFLAAKLVKPNHRNAADLDDLVSAGMLGLLDAIKKFDASRDNKFKTYAEFRIRGAMLDSLRDQDWVPRSVRDKARTVRLIAKHGELPTEAEVAAALEVSREQARKFLLEATPAKLLSLDGGAGILTGDRAMLHGFVSDDKKWPTALNALVRQAAKDTLARAIRALPQKQALVLSLYYYEDLNMKEIGRVLGVTESRVCQLHSQAVSRLRNRLQAHWDELVAIFD